MDVVIKIILIVWMNICVNEIKYTSALKKKKATGNIKLQVM
jgi:hypothetical protein